MAEEEVEWQKIEEVEKRSIVREKVIAAVGAKLAEKGCKGLDTFLTDRTLDRFTVANQGNVDGAVAQLTESWTWRCETEPRWQCCPLCIRDPMSHSCRAVGVDAEGRLVLYTCFATAHNRCDARPNLLHLQRLLEDAQELLDANPTGPGKWVFFIDFGGFTLSDANPATAQYAIGLLKHYPERLGSAILYDAGVLFDALWGVISPVLQDVTKKKICFTSSLDADEPALKSMGPEVLDWLRHETRENRTDFSTKKRYWEDAGGFPDEVQTSSGYTAEACRPPHDPRGTRDFVESGQYRQFLLYGEGPGEDNVPVVDIEIDRLFNGKLGVCLKGVIVSRIDVEEAGDFWKLGDEVLEVNCHPVQNGDDFGKEVKEALQNLPMTIKVFRHNSNENNL